MADTWTTQFEGMPVDLVLTVYVDGEQRETQTFRSVPYGEQALALMRQMRETWEARAPGRWVSIIPKVFKAGILSSGTSSDSQRL